MKNILHLCHVQNNGSRQIKNSENIFGNREKIRICLIMTSVTEAATAAR